jgi:acyl-CoA thioesterase
MDLKVLKKLGEGSPYYRHLNMDILEAGDGYARMIMTIQIHHNNILKIVHGGAIASLADQAGMRAVQTQLPEGQRCRTVQMDIHFLSAAKGGVLSAEGRVQKKGGNIAFSDVEVLDEKGKKIAIARCTIAIVDTKKTTPSP